VHELQLKHFGTDVIGFLDCRAICDRIGEGNAEFNDVYPAALHSKKDRHCVLWRGETCGHESDQSGRALAEANEQDDNMLSYARYLLFLAFKNLSNKIHFYLVRGETSVESKRNYCGEIGLQINICVPPFIYPLL
jgi:hypothetical protein